MKHGNAQQGFTLIEIMIALAIVSIALAALTQTIGVTILNQSLLESRIVATWVAEDELVKQHVLADQKDKQADAGQATMIEQLGREWSVELSSESTTVSGIQKRLVIVSDIKNPSDSVRLLTVVGD
ncbi:hypothetical protein MNBD_GAMMA04-739 [hydrothermal vent metagenome]|uniref:Type II secretion system protein GspI C-terminal domain-containing protein n=1 Tax=hydrothermal vent metagenome TaxID=652676 RepID=A0A3B0WPC5_9ZZZZ